MESELLKQLAEFNDKYLEVKAENERLKADVDYWKTLCQLAEDCLEKSPCDPDITSEQIEAWKAYHRFIKQFGANPLTTNP